MEFYKKQDVERIISFVEKVSHDYLSCEDKRSFGEIEMTDEMVKSFEHLYRGSLRCAEGIRSMLGVCKTVTFDNPV